LPGAVGADELSAAGVVIASVLLVAALPHLSLAVPLSAYEVEGERPCTTACDRVSVRTGLPSR
jgi:hypothetical protein